MIEVFPKSLNKLSNELVKKWTLSINTKGSSDLMPFFYGYLIVKVICFSIVFDKTFILKLYFAVA